MTSDRPAPRRLLVALALLALVATGAFVRIHTTLSDPNFRADSPERMVKSDPALLYYFVERIVDAGGRLPADFHANTHVEFPDARDIPRVFTLGQEFCVAWAYLLCGRPGPLHVFCVIAMGLFASLAVLGVWGLAFELTGKRRWALVASLLYLLMPANYRTMGAILIREDFSLPWLVLHLYLLVRAARRPSLATCAAAGLALVVALATWHAMRFVVTLEVLCLGAWFLRTARNPLGAPNTWCIPVILLAGCRLVPVLDATSLVTSLPVLVIVALWLAALIQRAAARTPPRLCALGVLVGLLVLARLFGQGAESDPYSHVTTLVWDKLRHFGRLPDDPAALSFESRLLWQGPFETATIIRLFGALLAGWLLLPVAMLRAVRPWARASGDARTLLVITFAVVTTGAALMVERLVILPGFLTPVVVVALLDGTLGNNRRAWAAGLVIAQACFFAEFVGNYWVTWYDRPQQEEQAAVIDWIRAHVPPDEPIATDIVTGPAILATAGNPIIMQPKYETAASRQRIGEFLDILFHGTPDALQAWLARHRCRYLLIDRVALWNGFRYVAGLAAATPAPAVGTPAYALMFDADPAAAARGMGMTLVYRSPVGLGSDAVRVFEVERGSGR